MQLPILDKTGKQIGQADLPPEIFEVEVNVGLMHQAYVRQMANKRQATAHTKTRSEVNRTKAKWYRQKGTGRARHGSRNAPIFVGGGKAHGPRYGRNYQQDMPRKMRRQALRSALSALLRDEQIVIVDSLVLDDPKTKLMQATLQTVAGTDNALVLYAPEHKEAMRAIFNLPQTTALHVGYLNIRDLLRHEKVVISVDALDHIKAHLG
ncbi:MAG: 50S ribosomal protein L4 [Anaerolineae bacterium]|nr:50S ribosomal protein L4 [Anaerolineae bacterium]